MNEFRYFNVYPNTPNALATAWTEKGLHYAGNDLHPEQKLASHKDMPGIHKFDNLRYYDWSGKEVKNRKCSLKE